jgi:CHC2 zinc finger
MVRIAESEIERLKREISVQRLAEGRGVKLKRHGADLIGLCPFHDDHEPSLVITPGKNLWNCLGACRRGRWGTIRLATQPSDRSSSGGGRAMTGAQSHCQSSQ